MVVGEILKIKREKKIERLERFLKYPMSNTTLILITGRTLASDG